MHRKLIHPVALLSLLLLVGVGCRVAKQVPGPADFPRDVDSQRTVVASDGMEWQLSIPAMTFADSMNGSLTIDQSFTGDVRSSFETETATMLLSDPVVLAFSRHQIARDGAHFELQVSITAEHLAWGDIEGNTILAMVRLDGAGTGIGDVRAGGVWTEALGTIVRLDSTPSTVQDSDENETQIAATMSIPLYATAEKMTVAIVAREGFVLSTMTSFPTTAKKAPTEKHGVTSDALQRPWVVLCDDKAFREAGRPETCETLDDFLDVGVPSPLIEAAILFEDASLFLAGKGFPSANVAHFPLQDLIQTSRDRGTPLGSIIELNEDENVQHNIAILRPGVRCGATTPNALGCYSHATQLIEVSDRITASDVWNAQGAGNVAAHELFHAVQAAMLPEFSARDDASTTWITEGTAEAVAFWTLALGDASKVLESRSFGRWRDWSMALNDTSDDLAPYQSWEYFALQNAGDLDFLRDLFSAMQGLDQTQNTYRLVSDALAATTGLQIRANFLLGTSLTDQPTLNNALSQENDLGIGYLQTIQERRPSEGYPHCDDEIVMSDLDGATLISGKFTGTILPMSSVCRRVRSIDHVELHGDACVKVSLPTAELDPKQVLIVSGAGAFTEAGVFQQMSYGGEPLLVSAGDFHVQVVQLQNLSTEALANKTAAKEWELDVSVGETCGNAGCFPTRVSCSEEICSLQQRLPGPASDPTNCWVTIAFCRNAGGCFAVRGGEDVEMSFGALGCAGADLSMHSFLDPSASNSEPLGNQIIDSFLPSGQYCGDFNFCRRIILCAK